jgi:hypothetical protein
MAIKNIFNIKVLISIKYSSIYMLVFINILESKLDNHTLLTYMNSFG